jgi:large subunit ribosomal protein L13
MRTVSIKPQEVERRWYVIDAAGKTLGRLATQIAVRLRGKNKPEYTPHMDLGDYIIVLNARKIHLTGKNKPQNQMYTHYTGFQNGYREISFADLMKVNPALIIEKTVKGMLPKGSLGRKLIKKLKVYADDVHPHEAQLPKTIVE